MIVKTGPKRRRRGPQDRSRHVSRRGWISAKKHWGNSRYRPLREPLVLDEETV